MLALLLAGCATRPVGPGLRLVGTEPFWGGTLTRQALTITRVDRPEVTVRNPGSGPCPPQDACFFGQFSGAGRRYVNARLQDGGRLSLIVDPEACSDGMSDRRYPFKASVTFVTSEGKAERLQGCAGPESLFRRGRR